jgi:hypothetical protein
LADELVYSVFICISKLILGPTEQERE